MQTIRERLNRIAWDPRENKQDYAIGYEDRIQKRIIEIPYTDIDRLEEGFMIIKGEPPATIPLHRIRHLKRNNAVVWKRPPRP